MRGNITRRGKHSWRIKYDTGIDPTTGRRQTAYVTIQGTKQDAQQELTRRLAALDRGEHVASSRQKVGEYLDEWLRNQHSLAPKTAERYRELIKVQIKPHLGAHVLQKLRPAHIASWHTTLLAMGRSDGGALSPRTVGHAHRVLRKALADAVRLETVVRNVCSSVAPPKVEDQELEILTAPQVSEVSRKLYGRALYPIAMLAFASGMRRGELLAIRWMDIDLDNAVLRVERSLEQTKAGLRFKAPKTKRGRRSITLPDTAVTALRAHRRQQLEQRIALGLGRMPNDALVFPASPTGEPRSPRCFTKEWGRTMGVLNLPPVTFHSLRHTHASALIAAKIDVLTLSRRLGHASPTVTLNVYGHLFVNTDDAAASAIDRALGELS